MMENYEDVPSELFEPLVPENSFITFSLFSVYSAKFLELNEI